MGDKQSIFAHTKKKLNEKKNGTTTRTKQGFNISFLVRTLK